MNLPGTNWLVYLGILADSTREWNQREFYIYVPELSPFHEGDVSPEYVNIPISIKNLATGSNECKDIKVTKTIKADYFGVESSKSVPTMVKGQQVLVVNFGKTGKYYWIPLERDDYLKTFERIRWSCADVATTNKAIVEDPNDIKARKATLTDDNTYFFEIDTRDKKRIYMSTSASDGEPWRYYFRIDPVERSVTIWDEHVDKNDPNPQRQNTIKLESRPDPNIIGRITLQNASGTTFKLEDKNMIISVPKNLMIDVGGDFITNVKENMATTIGIDASTKIGNNDALTIGNNRGVSIGNDDSLSVENNKQINVNKNYTVTTIGTFSETQNTRVSNTLTNCDWNTLTWKLNAVTSIDTTTITENIKTINTTMITQMFTHTAINANIKYKNCKNVIIKNPESDGAIPMSSIV